MTSLEITMKGKRVLVTGAGNGIGLALCRKLWSQGATVYGLDVNQDSLTQLTTTCPGLIPICVDLKDWDATRAVLKSTLKEPLDGLVNNAGVGSPTPFLSTTASSLNSVIGVNLRAMLNVSQVVVEGMKGPGGRGGAIVNVSSLASRFPTRASLPYNLSKAGVDMLTKSMAFEWGRPDPHSVRVNSVNPNIVMTALAGEWMAAGEGAKLKEKLIGRTPLGRVGEVDEVVGAVLFLLSTPLAAMVNGTHLFVDGGFSAA